MTWEALMAQQEKERVAYTVLRETRKAQLQKDQLELLKHCRFTGKKGHELIKGVFSKQYKDWLKMEQDEIDQLKHAHQMEIEAFSERQAKRDNIILLLQDNQDKNKTRNRGR